MSDAGAELLSRMALPSLIGQYIGKEVWGAPWIPYPWVQYVEQRGIDAVLDDTHERHIIINCPPQVGKTTWIELLMFWLLGHFPDKNQMYISYSDEFSEARSKAVRTMVKVFGKELFGIAVDPDFDKVGEWKINGHRGGMLSVGIGGQITGKPGDIIIIDDLVKNAEESRSAAAKRGHLAEWDSTIARRKQPGATVIVIATRWAEDDLSGALIERMNQPGYTGPQWEVLAFPAFAEPPGDEEEELTPEELASWRDVIGREYGEVLDCRFSRIEGREPADFFNIVRASTDPLVFNSLYQQSTTSAEGSMFDKKNWRYYTEFESKLEGTDLTLLPQMGQLVRVWDMAGTEGGGDWTVGTKIGTADGKVWVLDVIKFRKNSAGVLNRFAETLLVDGYGCQVLVEEEKGAAGKSTIAALEKLHPGYNIGPAKAEGDKKSRATLYSSEQQNRRVYLPDPAEATWDVGGFIKEHSKMMQDGRLPKHDDQIDTAAYAVLELVGRQPTDIFVPGGGDGGAEQDLMDAFFAQAVGGGPDPFA